METSNHPGIASGAGCIFTRHSTLRCLNNRDGVFTNWRPPDTRTLTVIIRDGISGITDNVVRIFADHAAKQLGSDCYLSRRHQTSPTCLVTGYEVMQQKPHHLVDIISSLPHWCCHCSEHGEALTLRHQQWTETSLTRGLLTDSPLPNLLIYIMIKDAKQSAPSRIYNANLKSFNPWRLTVVIACLYFYIYPVWKFSKSLSRILKRNSSNHSRL